MSADKEGIFDNLTKRAYAVCQDAGFGFLCEKPKYIDTLLPELPRSNYECLVWSDFVRIVSCSALLIKDSGKITQQMLDEMMIQFKKSFPISDEKNPDTVFLYVVTLAIAHHLHAKIGRGKISVKLYPPL